MTESSKPKNVLCLSGQIRHLERGYERIYENVIVPNNCDVVFHVWGDDSSESQQLFDRALSLYKPVNYVRDPYILFDKQDYTAGPYADGQGSKRIQTIMSMYYSIKQAFYLGYTYSVLTATRYRAFARCRFDWGIEEKIDFASGDLNTVNVYNDCVHNENCVTDHFAYGGLIPMLYYSSLFDQFRRVTDSTGCYFCSEILLGHWLEMSQISTCQIPLTKRPIPLH